MDNILNRDLFETVGSGYSDRATSNLTRNYNKGGGSVSYSQSNQGDKLSFRELAEKAGLQKLRRKGDYKCPFCSGKIWSSNRGAWDSTCRHTKEEIRKQLKKDAGLWVDFGSDRHTRTYQQFTTPGSYLTEELREELAQSWRPGSDPELNKDDPATYPREIVWKLNFSALSGLKNIQNFLSNPYYSGSDKGWISTGHGGESANQFKPSVPYQRNDTAKPAKYLTRSGGKFDFFTPKIPYQTSFWDTFLEDKSKVLGLTEGSKKSVALSFGYGVPSLALFGVDMWHRKNEGMLPELKKYAKDRKINLFFDADKTRKRSVWRATERFTLALKKAGATVAIAHWEEEKGKGIDDFLHNGHSYDDIEFFTWEEFAAQFPCPKEELHYAEPSPEGLAKLEQKAGSKKGDQEFWEWAKSTKLPIFLTHSHNCHFLLDSGFLAIGATEAWKFYQRESGKLHLDFDNFLKVGYRRQFYLLFPHQAKKVEDLSVFKLARLLSESLQRVSLVGLGDVSSLTKYLEKGGNLTELLTAEKPYDFDSKLKTGYLDCFKFTPDKIIDDRYLADALFALVEKYRICGIKSSKNTGKSVFVTKFLKLCGCGSLNPFQVNSLAYARDFDYGRMGLKSAHIKDLSGEDFTLINDIESHIEFCYDSIFKLPLNACDGKYLILDEAFGALTHAIDGATCRQKREQILSRLATFCKRAKAIILLEAELNDEAVELIKNLADAEDGQLLKILNTFRPKHGDVIVSLGSEVDGRFNPWDFTPLLNESLTDVRQAILGNYSIAIASDSKNFVKTVTGLIEKMQTSLCKEYGLKPREILSVHRDNKGNPNVQAFLADPTGYLLGNRPLVWLHTSTVRQGLSIEEKVDFFQTNYGFRFHLDTQGFTQMQGRVRSPIPRKIWSVPYLLSENNVKFTEASILQGFKNSIQSEAERYGLELKLKEEQQAKGFLLANTEGVINYDDFSVDCCSDRDLDNFQYFAAFCAKLANLDRARLRDNLRDFYQENTIANYSEVWGVKAAEVKKEYQKEKGEWGYFEGAQICNAPSIPFEEAQNILLNPKSDAELFGAKKAVLLNSLPGIEAILNPELAIFFTEFDKSAAAKLKLRWQLLNSDRSQQLRGLNLDLMVNQGRSFSPYLLTDYRSNTEVALKAKNAGLLEILEVAKEKGIDESNPNVNACCKFLNHKESQWLAGASSKKPGSKIKQLNRLLSKFGYELKQRSKKSKTYHLIDSYQNKLICPDFNNGQQFKISEILEAIADNYFFLKEVSAQTKTKSLAIYLGFLWMGKDWVRLVDLVANPEEIEAAKSDSYWEYLEVIEESLISLHEISQGILTPQETEAKAKDILERAGIDTFKMGGDSTPNPIGFEQQSPPIQTIGIASFEGNSRQIGAELKKNRCNDQTSLNPQKAILPPHNPEDKNDFVEGGKHTTKPTPREELESCRLSQPLKWRKPSLVFVNSMSDLFHARVSLKFIQQVFEVIKKCPQHTFQILTKRPRRMLELSPQLTWHPNIWMGVSVESQKYCDRIDILKQIPATVRFLSCEPLLGPLDLNLDGIQWVIVGGESGAKHRPMKEEWALDIRDQCQLAKVPFFFKQWGTVKPKNRTLENKFWDEMPRSRFAEQKAANH